MATGQLHRVLHFYVVKCGDGILGGVLYSGPCCCKMLYQACTAVVVSISINLSCSVGERVVFVVEKSWQLGVFIVGVL